MLLQYLNAVLDSGTLLFSFNTVILITIETYNYFHNCDKLNKKNYFTWKRYKQKEN